MIFLDETECVAWVKILIICEMQSVGLSGFWSKQIEWIYVEIFSSEKFDFVLQIIFIAFRPFFNVIRMIYRVRTLCVWDVNHQAFEYWIYKKSFIKDVQNAVILHKEMAHLRWVRSFITENSKKLRLQILYYAKGSKISICLEISH